MVLIPLFLCGGAREAFVIDRRRRKGGACAETRVEMAVVRGLAAVGALLALAACETLNVPSSVSQIQAWWRTTGVLAADNMEGRDTGSPGYDRAAQYVAERYAAAHLLPGGDNGTYFQRINFAETSVVEDGTTLTVRFANRRTRNLKFLQEVSVTPTWDMATRLDAPMLFRGYCAASDMSRAVRGAVVVCFGARRAGQTTAAGRVEAATRAGAVAIINVDDPGFTEEPSRWPVAYARTVVFADGDKPHAIPVLRLSSQTFQELADAAGRHGAEILDAGAHGRALRKWEFRARLAARFATQERTFVSTNVIGVLPGTDAALAKEPVLLGAHLDGYGHGTPVDGDALYNGALDDAAYVATLITFADIRAGQGFRRPLTFAAFTGEEKGLLGSRYLAAHPTEAAPAPVAVLNMDQLRPLYPLTILTTLGLDDSTLGQDVRDVATPMGIEVRADHEPQRNLLRRTDHWPFMQRGVPAVSFLFGFDPGGEAEARYHDWYARRYHAPQDDMSTPIDFDAQDKFHRFYFALTEKVANADAGPQWLPDSPNRPQTSH